MYGQPGTLLKLMRVEGFDLSLCLSRDPTTP